MITIWAAFMKAELVNFDLYFFSFNIKEFYVIAIIVGLVQGGVQALSRSFYAILIPDKNNQQNFYVFTIC